ncbi:P-granule-associated novel protein 1-like [Anopheles nili]|uniref:P-granule-associated novel protein 1-like n=1 Tax=Anopheles nili TaxID=185578 RepID=UPI00237AFEA9|nr:P-granule-associated novel protein 1-like [Anopheles nili]
MRTFPRTLLQSFPSVVQLDLTELQIGTIEPGAFDNGQFVRELQLSSNDVEWLMPNVFYGLPALELLLMNENKLRSLPRSAFQTTRNLTVLSMANNSLEYIEDGTFEATKKLQELNLGSNKLTHVDLSLVPSLFYVDVRHNLLEVLAISEEVEQLHAAYNHIHRVVGSPNERLIFLSLAHNNLTEVRWLARYPALNELDLSHNMLEVVKSADFVALHNLSKLLLNNNRLVALELNQGSTMTLPALRTLDLSYNKLLHVEKNKVQFSVLEQLYLDHNAIVKLKLAADHTLRNLTLASNDWDCGNLRSELLRIVSFTVMHDSDQNCRPDYQLEGDRFCCKESDKPYLDRLVQFLRQDSIFEKQRRAQGRCSGEAALSDVQDLSRTMNESGVLLQSSQQLQTELNQLQDEINQLRQNTEAQEQLLAALHGEIEANLRRYHVPKVGLVSASENLRKVFAHLKDRKEFMSRQTNGRQSEADAKRDEIVALEQENTGLQQALDEKKVKLSELKQEIAAKRNRVKQLEAKKNQNPNTRHITK